ncbi:MAG: hypothetical protein NTV87_15000 [Ignavibacteriae bacterium]|nr:hypothetical protein [Ignavibacteriota bacterium]
MLLTGNAYGVKSGKKKNKGVPTTLTGRRQAGRELKEKEQRSPDGDGKPIIKGWKLFRMNL